MWHYLYLYEFSPLYLAQAPLFMFTGLRQPPAQRVILHDDSLPLKQLDHDHTALANRA